MLAASGLLMLVFLRDDGLSRTEAGILLAVLAAYVGLMLSMEIKASRDAIDEEVVATHAGNGGRMAQFALVVLGVLLLIAGANRLVVGATAIAQQLGVSERVIGLTILAVGTSLPELASSVVAVQRGHGDLALGNVVGSNIFNVLCILGLTGLVAPLDQGAGAIRQDLWVMVGFSLALVALLHRGQTLHRTESGVLLLAYVVYVLLLF
jgi:cation:H+ antiporter